MGKPQVLYSIEHRPITEKYYVIRYLTKGGRQTKYVRAGEFERGIQWRKIDFVDSLKEASKLKKLRDARRLVGSKDLKREMQMRNLNGYLEIAIRTETVTAITEVVKSDGNILTLLAKAAKGKK